MADWRTRVEGAGFKAHPAVLRGPPPKGVSSTRALPDVHDALHQHDPTSKAPASQPILSKKAPPTTGRGRPAAFYSDNEPPRIGSEQVQPAPPPKLPGSTPTTPAHPPRPPLSALPQPSQESSNPATLKHPLPQPAQQGPPNKQVRHKAVPADLQVNPMTSMAAPSANDMSRMSAPSPKGPPASFLPTPGHFIHMREAAAWVVNGTHWFSILKRSANTWEEACRYFKSIQGITFQGTRSLSSRKKKSISSSSIRCNLQLYGMVVQSLASWQIPV